MKAILLLGGKSNRFWPLSEKPLFPICGKSLLQHQVDRLHAGGIDDILLVGSADNLADVSAQYPDMPAVQQDPSLPGMRGALLSALPEVGERPVLIVGGNDVIDPAAYKELIVSAADCDGALLAQKVTEYFPGGYLKLDGEYISGIEEKPGEGNEPSDLVNIVAHVHNDPARLLAELEAADATADDAYEQVLDTLFKEKQYRATAYTGAWQAVKYPWHMLELLEMLLAEVAEPVIHESVSVHETAVITGNVVIEEGTKVMPHATVVGPCYVGKNCILANNSLTRGSSIGDNCVVGYNTEVKGSVLHSHVWTHMSYLGDSVIGRNVSFGAGFITGNFRLDEGEVASVVSDEKVNTQRQKMGAVIGSNCRLGVQTSTNPGVKIGAGSFTSSGVFLTEDVPEKSFVRMKQGELKISENRDEVADPEDREQFKKKV